MLRAPRRGRGSRGREMSQGPHRETPPPEIRFDAFDKFELQ